ncbi:MAG: virulence RhuM family protein [Bifidobacteriaceae bacterium]|jgi:hypothetical protein|nr:virulence RhuM family protein [Bifidobacteriaceae bacterium]
MESHESQIVIYETDENGSQIDVRLENETVWLTQEQMSELFDRSQATISGHIANIFREGELDKTKSTLIRYDDFEQIIETPAQDNFIGNPDKINPSSESELETAESEDLVLFAETQSNDVKLVNAKLSAGRPVQYYNLDVIISVGYRVKSVQGTRFRQWATERLREYLTQGFTMNDEFLKNSGGGAYWKKLLSRIRDIRSSEKVFYRQVIDLYATSSDYDPKSLHSVEFFKIIQNKFHYAVHRHTAAEIIYDRADAEKDFMGLTVFAGDLPVLDEVRIAKNYLSINELEKLNRLVSAYFDLAEAQAIENKEMRMSDHLKALDNLMSIYGEGVLGNAGKVSHHEAIEKAEKEYRKYQVKTLSGAEKDYLNALKEIENKAKELTNE